MTSSFLSGWAEAAMTSLGFFWTALWAFCLGYLISAMIQVLVTEARMQRTMGRTAHDPSRSRWASGSSGSCAAASPSARAGRSSRRAPDSPALAFLLASTNLVIELGILIYVFLGWPFVAGEYLGGLLLIAIMCSSA
ncbi:MAG: permease [Myxococcota bacterium]